MTVVRAIDYLGQPLSRAVGDSAARKLTDVLGLQTVGDLLRYYPRRYVERGRSSTFRELVPDELVTVVGTVSTHAVKRGRTAKTLRLEVVVVDDEGLSLTVTFFGPGQVNRRQKQLMPGVRAMFSGKVTLFATRTKRVWQLTHPDCEVLPDGSDASVRMRPVISIYPIKAGIKSWQIAKSVGTVLDVMGPVPDPLPLAVRRDHALLGLADALEKVHRPEEHADHRKARRRLRFDEALVAQVVLAQRRAQVAVMPAVPRERRARGLLERFDARLEFTLTTGQREVGEQIAAELARRHPMHRLLQGEVGSGKTLVALRAMLQVVDSGGQAALLAPTEVLAQQHHRSVCAMLGDLAQAGMLGGAPDGTRVALLTGSLGAAARREALRDAASGAAGIVVGTHALLEERVQFADLGLVVVDEQHRFGVEQRAALTAKADTGPPHVLVMTATPIPRTIAMTVFGDLDVSSMRELPPGRAPVQTTVVPAAEKPEWLERVWARIREEVGKGHQAYVVCARIGDQDDGPAGDGDDAGVPLVGVVEAAEQLADGPLRGLRVEMLHGRMTPEDKDRVMSGFAAGKVDAVVATTVVEVGVDVPNASTMVVLDADRFGVSQLHQLRGRVGRGSTGGLCLLVTALPAGSPARARLDAVAATSDGFELAQLDLESRREGDVLGAVQSGRRSSLRLLSVLRHEEVIRAARAAATRIVDADPGLDDHPALAEAVAATIAEEKADYLEKT
jgi:ATP-dependent DNA helicase RecG